MATILSSIRNKLLLVLAGKSSVVINASSTSNISIVGKHPVVHYTSVAEPTMQS